MQPAYATLEDFLASQMLTVDGSVDDGWNEALPVKGREIEATILFADITGFSARTAELDPTATLAFVNHFFAWISAEALHHGPGVVDKYIGDEVMVVFSDEFGSADPFLDAVHTARAMGQRDVFAFMPHIGIASGRVIVGYVGSRLGYDVSVFGGPVARAARCAKVSLPDDLDMPVSSYVTAPASEVSRYAFRELIPTRIRTDPDGQPYPEPHGWRLLDPRDVPMRNLPPLEVSQLVNCAIWAPSQTAEDRAREVARMAAEAGRRWVPQCEERDRRTAES